LRDVEAVVGVAGGFAVAGVVGARVCVAHYDIASRTARLHSLEGLPEIAGQRRHWWYVPAEHVLAVEQGTNPVGLSLPTGGPAAVPHAGPGSVRKSLGATQVRALRIPIDTTAIGMWEGRDATRWLAPEAKRAGPLLWPALVFEQLKGALFVE